MRLFFAMFSAYLIGAIPTGFLIARFAKSIDIRKHGSGNVGATNVLRSVGKSAALTTLILDILKGVIAVTLFANIAYDLRIPLGYDMYLAVLGICAVAGHNWPIFLNFKGGKGVATSSGVLLALCPKLLLGGLCVWVLIFSVSKIVSLSSIISSASIPLAAYFFEYETAIKFLTIILAVLTIARHHQNIRRLIKKEEKRIVKS